MIGMKISEDKYIIAEDLIKKTLLMLVETLSKTIINSEKRSKTLK